MPLRFAALGFAVAMTVVAGAVGFASTYGKADGDQLSARSRFASCTSDSPARQTGRVYPRTEIEPHVAVNPTDPSNIVAVWQQDRWSNTGARGIVAAVSKNGGASWKRVTVPRLTLCSGGAYQRASDPWLSFGPNGNLYLATLGLRKSGTTASPRVSVSRDGGLTWGKPRTLRDDGAWNDKETVTADPGRPGNVYAVWHRLAGGKGPMWFARSTDGGFSWRRSRQIYDPGAGNAAPDGEIVVTPNGTLVDVFAFVKDYATSDTRTLAVLRSKDAGRTWSRASLGPAMRVEYVRDPDTGAYVKTGNQIPQTAINRNPSSAGYGDIYAVWGTGRFSGGDYADIALSRSTDGGLHWSAPIRVNKTPAVAPRANRHAFTPTVEVAADGSVGVSYFDFRRNDPHVRGVATNRWFVHCHPNADCTKASNWTGELRVTTRSFDIERAPYVGGLFLGDYMGMATAGRRFLPVISRPSDADRANVWLYKVTPA